MNTFFTFLFTKIALAKTLCCNSGYSRHSGNSTVASSQSPMDAKWVRRLIKISHLFSPRRSCSYSSVGEKVGQLRSCPDLGQMSLRTTAINCWPLPLIRPFITPWQEACHQQKALKRKGGVRNISMQLQMKWSKKEVKSLWLIVR